MLLVGTHINIFRAKYFCAYAGYRSGAIGYYLFGWTCPFVYYVVTGNFQWLIVGFRLS